MANCDVPIFIGPLLLLAGLLAFVSGAIAWGLALPAGLLRAFTSIVGTAAPSLDAPRRWTWRIVGPLNGTAFVLLGAYVVWGSIQCRPLNLGIPIVSGPLSLTPWLGQFPFMLFALGIGVYNARQMAAMPMRIIYVVLTLGFAFGAGQAAGFHVGVHAEQWGVIAFAMLLLSGIVSYIDSRVRQTNR